VDKFGPSAGVGRLAARSFEFVLLERFRFICCHLKITGGGIFSRKMPVGLKLSVNSRIETAVQACIVDYHWPRLEVQAITT